VGAELARLTGLRFISLNDLAPERKLGKRESGEFVVDISRLRKEVGRVKTDKAVLCGHLLPLVLSRGSLDFVAVLRCSPSVLRRRYLERRYPESKIGENLEAEVLDLVSAEAVRVFGPEKVSEFDTTRIRKPRTVAARILETLRRQRKRCFGTVNWSDAARKDPESLVRLLDPPDGGNRILYRKG
jgi:adenylate kinase